MKKTIFSFLVAIMFGMTIGSCGNNSKGTATDVDSTTVDTMAVDSVVADTVAVDTTVVAE